MTLPRLKLVDGKPVQIAPSLGDLRERAAKLFPASPHLQAGWVAARQIITARRPLVEIGGAHCDITRTPRTLREAGINRLDETYEIPWFLSRRKRT